MKPFAYVNPANEKDAVAALSKKYEEALPIGGGQDLLARMKDYIDSPDRIVNVKGLDATVTATPDGGMRIGSAVKIVDRLTAESQIYGGIVGSLNFALFEDRILDRVTGQMVNPNMEWYLLAGMSDVPKIDIILNNMPERGVIGIGEPPTVSTASAIANAVRNATGATIRSLPLHPHKVLAALEQQKAGGTN